MDKSGTSHIARALRGEGSPEKPSLARGFRLVAWRVRPDLCAIERDGRSVQLEPKTMGVLLCLAQNAPATVTREQLIDEVWSGRIVTDEVLSRAISLLRSQLEDDAHEPRFVRTIPRIGYALVAAVEALEPEVRGTVARFASRRAAFAVGAAVLALLAGLSWWLLARDARVDAGGPVRLAVLPLEYLGSGTQDRYIADGLTEELTVNLSRVNGLRVVARNSAKNVDSRGADLQEIARSLGATHLVTGSVRTDGGRLRVTVHLSESSSGTELWADSYDRGSGDLFGVQAEIAAAMTRALREQLPVKQAAGGDSAAALFARPPANADAYRLFLQGRQQLARRGEDGIRAAIGLFEDALASDPAFLRGQLALAFAYSLLANVAPAESSAALARADQALATVARQTAMSGEIHAVRAALELERNHWIDAAGAFDAALAATPDDTELRLLHSQMLGAAGRRDTALNEARIAAAADPLSPAVNLRLAVLHMWADRNDEAASHLKIARELGLASAAAPELAMMLLVRERRFDQLRETLQTVQRRRGQSDEWVASVVSAIEDPGRGAVAAATISRAAAAGQVDELVHLGALVLAHQHQPALDLLLSRPTLRTLELEFLWSREAAALRSLPDFQRLVTQFGLDAYWDRYGWPPECAREANGIRCRGES